MDENMEDESEDNMDGTENRPIDFGPTSAENIRAELHRAGLSTGRPTAEALVTLFALMRHIIFPFDSAFLVGPEEPGGRCRLEICNNGEATSLVVNSAPVGDVRALVERNVNRGDANQPNQTFYGRQLEAVAGPCKCDSPFHQFVQEMFLSFVVSGSQDAFFPGRRQPRINVIDPCRVQYYCHRFRLSPLQFLLAFQKYVTAASALDVQRGEEFWELLLLIKEAIDRAVRSTNIFSWPGTLPCQCPWELHAPQRAGAAVPNTDGNNGIFGAQQVDNDNDFLSASRNQANPGYGEAAGVQCLAMAAMAARFHHLLGGVLASVSSGTLDMVLDLGNELYKIARAQASLAEGALLNFDDLKDGMQRFDRQGWPTFSPDELNPTSWEDLRRGVEASFNNGGADGFILIVNGRAVVVMRDRVTGRFCLFDSHGSNQLPTDLRAKNTFEMPPAYMMRFATVQDLIDALRVQFGSFDVCEVHMYGFGD